MTKLASAMDPVLFIYNVNLQNIGVKGQTRRRRTFE